MPLDLSTLDDLTPYKTKTAFQKIQYHANNLEAQLREAKAQLAALPKPLTLDDIRAALSAGGSHALNLTGLTGTPQAIAQPTTANPTPAPPSPVPPAPPPAPPTPPPVNPCGAQSDHTAVVVAAKADEVALGNPFATDCDVFKIAQRVVANLQAAGEKIGFLIKTTGANVCANRSTSRVMYADGSFYKILIDADPGGANTPEWSYEGQMSLASYDGPPC